MSRRKRGLAPLVAGLALIACSLSGGTPAAYQGALTISAPNEITAGNRAVALIRADAPAGTAGVLTAVGSYGARAVPFTLSDGLAEIVLPDDVARRAGALALRARIGSVTAYGAIQVAPAPPHEPVVPLVGPRSIIADGRHWAAVVVIPEDGFGNPAAPGTEVTVRSTRAAGVATEERMRVSHLVAWTRLWSDTAAGRRLVAASAGQSVGPERELQEVAGWPVHFAIRAIPPEAEADGRSLLKLRTTVLADAHDNIVPDGTEVTFVVQQDGQARRIPAITLSGVAEAEMPADARPGVATISGSVFGVESDPIAVRFLPGPVIGDIPLVVAKGVDSTTIRAGPLAGSLGQYVPDGTVVSFEIAGTAIPGTLSEAVSDGGYAKLDIRNITLRPGRYRVRVSAGSGLGETRFDMP